MGNINIKIYLYKAPWPIGHLFTMLILEWKEKSFCALFILVFSLFIVVVAKV